MKNKAIIFDLDGTAVDSPIQKFPTYRLIKQIKRLKNDYYLCAATGRVWSFGKHVLKALELEDPCIISAGTQICNPHTGEILWQRTVDNNAMREVIKIIQDYPDYKILYNDNDENEYLYGGMSPLDFNFDGDIYFFEQVFVPFKVADEIYERLVKIPEIAVVKVVAQRPGCNDIHVINKEATKEHAIQELLKMLGVNKTNTIGIGDGGNDIHLFNAVNYKVAMGNGVDAIKNSADIIIGDVSDDGLAKYLETL